MSLQPESGQRGAFPASNHLLMVRDRRRVEALYRALDRAVRPGDVVCDLGCGTGIFSLHAARLGARVYAVDVDEFALRGARESAAAQGLADRLTFLQADATAWRPPEKVDLVFSELLSVWLLLEPQITVIANARSFLKPGGRLIPERVINLVELGYRGYASEQGAAGEGGAPLMAPNGECFGVSAPDRMSASVVAFEVDLYRDQPLRRALRVPLRSLAAGRIDCARLSTVTDLGDGVLLDGCETAAPPEIVPLIEAVEVERGEELLLAAELDFEDPFASSYESTFGAARFRLLREGEEDEPEAGEAEGEAPEPDAPAYASGTPAAHARFTARASLEGDPERRERMLRAFDRLLGPEDLACVLSAGSGDLAIEVARRCRKVFVVEPHPGLMAIAQRRLEAEGLREKVELFLEDPFEFFPPEPVDRVVAEMLSTWLLGAPLVPTLSCAARDYLKPGGRLLPERAVHLVELGEMELGRDGIEVRALLSEPPGSAAPTPLTAPTVAFEVTLGDPDPWRYELDLELRCLAGGLLNCARLSSLIELTEGVALSGSSDFLWPELVPLEAPLRVERGARVRLEAELDLGPRPGNDRFLFGWPSRSERLRGARLRVSTIEGEES